MGSFRRTRHVISRVMPDRWSPSPEPFDGKNVGMVFVDGDNLRNYIATTQIEFNLEKIIEWLTPENTGIDEIAGVHVFITKVTHVTRRWDIKMSQSSSFTVHTYSRAVGEPGYTDEQMYRLAWKEVANYRTAVYISNDKGFADAAALLRTGRNPFIFPPQVIKNPPEVILISTYHGKDLKWIEAHDVTDLDKVLHEVGARGPVRRPVQP